MQNKNSEIELIIKSAFDNIYSKVENDQINVFLCGAAGNDPFSFRNLISASLKEHIKFNVVYPEWLFSNLMANENQDLLTLENELAKNVDIIVIPLEGLGVICELGAFASYEQLIDRILVLNSSIHKRKHSFITDGPIRLIRKKKPNNIIYYDSNDKRDAVEQIMNRLIYFKKTIVSKEVTNLFNLSRFLGIVIAMLQPINRIELLGFMSSWNSQIPQNYFDPAVEMLVEKKHLLASGSGSYETFKLTKEGFHFYMVDIAERLDLKRYTAKLRAHALWQMSRFHRKNVIIREREICC